MEASHEGAEQLVGVLLLVAAETLPITSDRLLEVDRSNRLVHSGPETSDERRELDGNVAASFRCVVDVFQVLVVHEVGDQDVKVGQTLENAVHVASVAQIFQARSALDLAGAPDRLEIPVPSLRYLCVAHGLVRTREVGPGRADSVTEWSGREGRVVVKHLGDVRRRVGPAERALGLTVVRVVLQRHLHKYRTVASVVDRRRRRRLRWL